MEELHRVFVGGLFDAITKDELKDRFQSFGQVSDVTIVHKRDGEGNISKTFGYVNLKTTTQKLNKCFALFGGTKWKGHELKVQLAKEDFMARLERERNEPAAEKRKKKKKNMGPSKTYTDILETTSAMRKIIPGTPVEGERNWVIGKYGRPLPIMHIPKLGSKKTVKVDPSKFCHCLRRLPDKDDGVVNVDSLTWSLDNDMIKIKKKKKKREHCEDDNVDAEINSCHEDMEIEPIKKKKKKKKQECNGEKDLELELDNIETDTEPKKKKRKEKENHTNLDPDKTISMSEVTSSNDNINLSEDKSEDALIKKKKKKKKKHDVDESILEDETVDLEQTGMQQIKKKRKKEKTMENSMDIDQNEVLEQKSELETSISTRKDLIEENKEEDVIKNELIIPETLFMGQHDESLDSNASDDEKDKSILSKSIVEQLLEKSASSSSTQLCEAPKTSLGTSIVDQLTSLDKKKSENLSENSIDDGKEIESESDDDAEENLFDFEFEDIAGENKKAFLEKLMSNIEVRDETNGISDESSADDSSSDEESDNDDESFDVGSSSQAIEKEVSEDLTSTDITSNSISDENSSTNQDESPQVEVEKNVKPKKPKKKEKDNEKDIKKSKIQNSNKQEKHALSEEKRQKSLEARNSQIQQNKGLVSKALKDVDSTTAPTNRIVFSDNDSDDGDETPINITEITEALSKETIKETKTDSKKSEESKSEKPGTKPQLFDSDSDSEEEEDSDEEEIVVKPQFQGKEGEKLFKLQQKFGGDERFKLDERFAENDGEAEKKVEPTEDGEEDEEEDTQKEKEMNMSILEQVLGKPLTGEKKEREYVHQRYDPDNVDREKFEVKDESADGKDEDEDLPKKKKKTEAPKIELPEVSKETFFNVNESIKDLFGKGESASFSFFGGGDDQSNDTQADKEDDGEEQQKVDEPMKEESSESKIKEPSWKKGLDEMNIKEKEDNTELGVIEEKKELFDKKHTFLYIPEDDERLEAGKRFKRTEGIEEVTNQWRALRKTLTEDYKKKHKDAVRRVRKMREKRFNRT